MVTPGKNCSCQWFNNNLLCCQWSACCNGFDVHQKQQQQQNTLVKWDNFVIDDLVTLTQNIKIIVCAPIVYGVRFIVEVAYESYQKSWENLSNDINNLPEFPHTSQTCISLPHCKKTIL